MRIKPKNLHFTIYFLLFTILIGEQAVAQQVTKYFMVQTGKDKVLEARFLLYLPEGYDSLERSWPLLLFLHGRGERGEMIELVKKHGPPRMIEYGYKFPYIVISPQCPEDQEAWPVDMLDMLLDEMVLNYRIDTSRIYVTGLSMGGTGTWKLAINYPDRFAAIVPVCGRVDAQYAPVVKELPIWVFHGVKDDVIPFSNSENMVTALRELGSPVKFTIYPDANHDAWTDAYNTPELWEWLGEQALSGH